ncbi:hypothetical protein EB118_03790 [bacterium]|nr:hypothetical protein [bacterium]NBX97340.1 hypothetical protein [bacterium]NDC94913.1 hypothetical protein [bacterium]NDD84673.1 hypothetical protein [bacterium]NDG29207.1 hypothetical protein [bacterium]
MKKNTATKLDAAQSAKALQALFASDYVDKKKLYKENFIRGITFGIGSFIGATIGVAVVLWVLSWFGQVPLIGGFVKDIEDTVNAQKK